MNNKPICKIDSTGTKDWYLNGNNYSYKEWLKLIPNPLKYAWIKFNEQQTNL